MNKYQKMQPAVKAAGAAAQNTVPQKGSLTKNLNTKLPQVPFVAHQKTNLAQKLPMKKPPLAKVVPQLQRKAVPFHAKPVTNTPKRAATANAKSAKHQPERQSHLKNVVHKQKTPDLFKPPIHAGGGVVGKAHTSKALLMQRSVQPIFEQHNPPLPQELSAVPNQPGSQAKIKKAMGPIQHDPNHKELAGARISPPSLPPANAVGPVTNADTGIKPLRRLPPPKRVGSAELPFNVHSQAPIGSKHISKPFGQDAAIFKPLSKIRHPKPIPNTVGPKRVPPNSPTKLIPKQLSVNDHRNPLPKTAVPIPHSKLSAPKPGLQSADPKRITKSAVPKQAPRAAVPNLVAPKPTLKRPVPKPIQNGVIPTAVVKSAVPKPITKAGVPKPVLQASVQTPLTKPAQETTVQNPMHKTGVPKPVLKTALPNPNTRTAFVKPVQQSAVQKPNSKTSVQKPGLRKVGPRQFSKRTVRLPVSKTVVRQPISVAGHLKSDSKSPHKKPPNAALRKAVSMTGIPRKAENPVLKEELQRIPNRDGMPPIDVKGMPLPKQHKTLSITDHGPPGQVNQQIPSSVALKSRGLVHGKNMKKKKNLAKRKLPQWIADRVHASKKKANEQPEGFKRKAVEKKQVLGDLNNEPAKKLSMKEVQSKAIGSKTPKTGAQSNGPTLKTPMLEARNKIRGQVTKPPMLGALAKALAKVKADSQKMNPLREKLAKDAERQTPNLATKVHKLSKSFKESTKPQRGNNTVESTPKWLKKIHGLAASLRNSDIAQVPGKGDYGKRQHHKKHERNLNVWDSPPWEPDGHKAEELKSKKEKGKKKPVHEKRAKKGKGANIDQLTLSERTKTRLKKTSANESLPAGNDLLLDSHKPNTVPENGAVHKPNTVLGNGSAHKLNTVVSGNGSAHKPNTVPGNESPHKLNTVPGNGSALKRNTILGNGSAYKPNMVLGKGPVHKLLTIPGNGVPPGTRSQMTKVKQPVKGTKTSTKPSPLKQSISEFSQLSPTKSKLASGGSNLGVPISKSQKKNTRTLKSKSQSLMPAPKPRTSLEQLVKYQEPLLTKFGKQSQAMPQKSGKKQAVPVPPASGKTGPKTGKPRGPPPWFPTTPAVPGRKPGKKGAVNLTGNG
ncbi:nascent polypeptide-associated complex subunit alpha, muscle-specific form-like [Lineus longissimus]|uniref:nascent polypeptide-associated complex subunit alpha, muscle-specific form-like n=1 Tax=Lineus longissimus TaxID=88925 RepID=UPI00315CA9F1